MSSTVQAFSQTRLYLGKLPYGAEQKDIENLFQGYGRILQLVLKHGYAFVELDNARDAEDAVRDLNGRKMQDMSVVVEFAQIQSNWTYNYRKGSPTRNRNSPTSSSSPSRVRSPRAAEWYKKMHPSRNENYAGDERHRSKLSTTSEERHAGRARRHSSDRIVKHARTSGQSRSRSPLISNTNNSRYSQISTKRAIKREHLPNLDDDGMDEYEEEQEDDEPFFKLLDHQSELEAMAADMSLQINIRSFDCSVAFGYAIPVFDSRKQTAAKHCAFEKWIVFTDKGSVVLVNKYDGTYLLKEHNVPKFEWEPFLGAIRGMCEKFLLNK